MEGLWIIVSLLVTHSRLVGWPVYDVIYFSSLFSLFHYAFIQHCGLRNIDGSTTSNSDRAALGAHGLHFSIRLLMLYYSSLAAPPARALIFQVSHRSCWVFDSTAQTDPHSVISITQVRESFLHLQRLPDQIDEHYFQSGIHYEINASREICFINAFIYNFHFTHLKFNVTWALHSQCNIRRIYQSANPSPWVIVSLLRQSSYIYYYCTYCNRYYTYYSASKSCVAISCFIINFAFALVHLFISHPKAEIGRAHVWTPVTSAHLVCRLLLEKKKNKEVKEP